MTLIRREDAMGAVQDHFNADGFKGYDDGQKMMDRIKALPSAEAVSREFYEDAVKANHGLAKENSELKEQIESAEAEWIPCSERLPSENGRYLVTYPLYLLKDKWVDVLRYGKPLMPNIKVKGKCWYRSDDEYGDVVYDEVIAWMPLPKPYREESEA